MNYSIGFILISVLAVFCIKVSKCDKVTIDGFTSQLSSNENKRIMEDDEAVLLQFHELYLQQSSIIFGLINMANESNVNATCYSQLRQIQRGILGKEAWALKVLDASGTKPPGFMFGQNYWLGSREVCGAAQSPVAITLSENLQRLMHFSIMTERAPFDVDYRVVYLRHHSPWQVELKIMSEQIIHIGLCLPSVCSSAEIERLSTDYVSRGMFVDRDIYDIRPQVVYTKDLKLSESFYQRRAFKIVVGILIFTITMIIAASVKSDKSKNKQEAMEKDMENKNELVYDDDIFKAVNNFVKCFDISTNFAKLFELKANRTDVIPVINGFRSVCAFSIILPHVLWFSYFTMSNKPIMLLYGEKLIFQFLIAAQFLVDVFFTISGVLQTYNFMRTSKQMEKIRQNSFVQNAKHFAMMLFHRYLRLAPLYLILMVLVDNFCAYIEDVSVFHIHDRFDEKCSQYWWRNVLFIQSHFNLDDMCLSWTWSLACEMQYSIVATICLFTYAKYPKFVKTLVAGSFAATISWSYIIGLNTKFQLSADSVFATRTDVYISPFVRIMPYVMGAITAWYLVEKQSKIEVCTAKEKCIWNMTLFGIFLCIFGSYKRDIPVFAAISVLVISRFIASLITCWMIVASATGRSTWWSRILEAKVFQHINRVSYAIYLLNPCVILFFFSLSNASTHLDLFMLCVQTSGFAVIIYLASVVFTLAFEIPYRNWSSLMLKADKQKAA